MTTVAQDASRAGGTGFRDGIGRLANRLGVAPATYAGGAEAARRRSRSR